MARKIFNSAIWAKPPLYLKVWLWILGQASHMDRTAHGQNYLRGEFITTREKIIRANGYRHNRRMVFPTLKQIRRILEWLVSQGMIRVTPIPDRELGLTRADTGARTWAYLGILISVVNYGTYQALDTYTRADTGADHSDELGPENKNGIQECKRRTSFSASKKPEAGPFLESLRERYPDQNLIDEVFRAIASTRQRGKVADSILSAFLQECQKFPVGQVEAGMKIYLDKDYASQSKNSRDKSERYLLGIIRNQTVEPPKRESTGSALLDAYYARNRT